MKWYVSTKDIDEIVEAANQWEAFDALRHRNPADFGLVVEAQAVNKTSEESICIRTSMLFGRWGKPEVGRLFVEAAMKQGLPDTSDTDLFPGK